MFLFKIIDFFSQRDSLKYLQGVLYNNFGRVGCSAGHRQSPIDIETKITRKIFFKSSNWGELSN